MAYPGAALTAPFGSNVDFSSILPARIILQNKETKEPLPAIIKKISSNNDDDQLLLKSLWHLLNYEIVEGGDSYPFEAPFTFDQFVNYYASHDLFVIVREEPLKEDNTISVDTKNDGEETTNSPTCYNFGNTLIGSVHIRPNFPARSCIVANGAFLVVPQHRRYGAAQVLGSFFPIFAKMLGYRTTLFNLVFEQNMPSVLLWRKLGYPEIGRVECAGMMKDKKTGQIVESAAFMYSINLYEEGRVIVANNKHTKKKENNSAFDDDCYALELTLEDVLKHIPSKVFGKFLVE